MGEDLGRGGVDSKAINDVFEAMEPVVTSSLQSAPQKLVMRIHQVLYTNLVYFTIHPCKEQ